MGGRLGRGHRSRHLLLAPRLRWGGLRRTRPLHDRWSRGLPVDRPYIEDFLATHGARIVGDVLEVQSAVHSTRFGAPERMHVLDLHPAPGVTVVADLSQPDALPAEAYDCIVLPQTLQFVGDPLTAVRSLHRSLRPGGTLLLSVPCLSPVRPADVGGEQQAPDLWRWTVPGLRRLLEQAFDDEDDRVDVTGYGNVLTAAAFLYGLGAHELTPRERAAVDPAFPVVVAAAATRSP